MSHWTLNVICCIFTVNCFAAGRLLCSSSWFLIAIILSFGICNLFFFIVSGSLMSKYKHTDSLYNSGLVCGRLLDINRALLQQVEVTISVVWDQNQIPIPTSGNIYIYTSSLASVS